MSLFLTQISWSYSVLQRIILLSNVNLNNNCYVLNTLNKLLKLLLRLYFQTKKKKKKI